MRQAASTRLGSRSRVEQLASKRIAIDLNFHIRICTVPPLIPKFLRGRKVRKIGPNWGFGSMPAKPGRFWKKRSWQIGLSCSLENLLGKLGVLHPNILSPVRWTAIYKVWGVLGLEPTIFLKFGGPNSKKRRFSELCSDPVSSTYLF